MEWLIKVFSKPQQQLIGHALSTLLIVPIYRLHHAGFEGGDLIFWVA
jgi:hypothetical protein